MKRKFFLFAVLFCCSLCGCSTRTIEVEEFSEDSNFEDKNIAGTNEKIDEAGDGNFDSSKQAEAEKCVRTYFEALSEGDEKKAELCFREADPERGIRIRVWKEFGIREFDILKLDSYPLEENEDEWLFLIFYELAVDNFESRLPGMQSLLVYFDDGSWYLKEGTVEEESEMQMILSILESDEVSDQVMECNQAFQDVVWEEEGLQEWLYEVQNEMERAVAEALLEEETGTKPEIASEPESEEAKRYEVKMGDCLWRIAQEKLGDGMSWKELYKLNQAVIGDDPNLIHSGILLELPEQ